MAIISGDKSITALALEKLIKAHDGDMALLYLYTLATGESDTEKAAGELCRTLSQMDEAAEKLKRLDISFSGNGSAIPEPCDELPDYTAEDIAVRVREDESFGFIVRQAQQVLGHVLSTPDMKKLFGIYDFLKLPPDIILLLLNHCVELSPGRVPSMRFIEKQAYHWANLEILTPEQADDYIRSSAQRRDRVGAVCSVLGIQGRKPTATESKHISAWLDMGFEEDAIGIAYDRTVTNTGSLKWAYMDKILQSWHQKGLHSPREINEKDSRGSRGSTPHTSQPVKIDLEKLRAGLDD